MGHCLCVTIGLLGIFVLIHLAFDFAYHPVKGSPSTSPSFSFSSLFVCLVLIFIFPAVSFSFFPACFSCDSPNAVGLSVLSRAGVLFWGSISFLQHILMPLHRCMYGLSEQFGSPSQVSGEVCLSLIGRAREGSTPMFFFTEGSSFLSFSCPFTLFYYSISPSCLAYKLQGEGIS